MRSYELRKRTEMTVTIRTEPVSLSKNEWEACRNSRVALGGLVRAPGAPLASRFFFSGSPPGALAPLTGLSPLFNNLLAVPEAPIPDLAFPCPSAV